MWQLGHLSDCPGFHGIHRENRIALRTYTSPFTFNSDYLIDRTKEKGKLRNFDPLKQSFLFLPNENPKRPIIVPQEYLILNDDPLLQEDIPQSISDPLPPIQPIASQPLGDCKKSYYNAIAQKRIFK